MSKAENVLFRYFKFAGTPVDGTSGTYAGDDNNFPGVLLVDTTNKKLYQNTNTQASPTWSSVGDIATADIADGAVTSSKLATGAVTEVYLGTGAVTADKIGSLAVEEAKINTAAVTVTKIGTGAVTSVKRLHTVTTKSAKANLAASERGVINVSTDAIYIYLPTYVGNTGLEYIVKVTAAYSSGVVVTGEVDGGLIDGNLEKQSTAIYDMLDVICDGAAWHVVGKVGTWTGFN
jgi:hypothetical protein